MADPHSWGIGLLDEHHNTSNFSSKSEPLNRFLKEYALSFHQKGICRIYAACLPGQSLVGGYYTLSCGQVVKDNFSRTQARHLRGYAAPVALLGKLAVTDEYAGKGLGTELLVHALRNAVELSKRIGIYAVEVNAKDGKRAFYERFGFDPLVDDENHLFLSMKKLNGLRLIDDREVIESYQRQYPDPIMVAAGDVVLVERRDSEWPGWLWCVHADGKSGWVPETYLVVEGNAARVTRVYSAWELTVAAGEVVRVQYEEAGWAWSTNATGESGWLPVKVLVQSGQ